MPKKVFATHVSWFEHFFHDFFVLLFIKLLEIQHGCNWLNFSGHVHLGTRSRDIDYAFHFMGHFRSKVMDESLKYV